MAAGEDKFLVGIDFGTGTAKVGVWQSSTKSVEILTAPDGHRETPAVVAYTDEERLVGTVAEKQAYRNLKNTVIYPKVLLGRSFAETAEMQSNFYYTLVDVNGMTGIELQFKGKRKVLSPTEAVSAVLADVKSVAEDYAGRTVTDVVLSIPSNFTGKERNELRMAAEKAGMNVSGEIDEHVACAIACGLDVSSEPQRVLVIDAGAMKCQASILYVKDGLLQNVASAEAEALGGSAIDTALLNLLSTQFRNRTKIDIIADGNKKAMSKLRSAAKKSKHKLSHTNQTVVDVESLAEGCDFNYRLSRARFEMTLDKIFGEMRTLVEGVLTSASMARTDIDTLLLAGGSMNIPYMRTKFSSMFPGRLFEQSVLPEHLVVAGASIHAGILAGRFGRIRNEKFTEIELPTLSQPISLRLQDGDTRELFSSGTILPCETSIVLEREQNQTKALVSLYEPEDKLACKSL